MKELSEQESNGFFRVDLRNAEMSAAAGTETAEERMRRHKFEERLQSIVIMVGVPPHIKGFKFLKDAVRATVVEPCLIDRMTKGLYPRVAENNLTTPSKVERAIRHAIDVSWQRGKIENINGLFGVKVVNKSEKPTSGELIALIAGKLALEYTA